ncbi:VCBS domain-containing protein, partial [Seohaeicola zhoushanensis]|uniref:VCBS domain-containing protein n=1 Tax=Seohaeicola zhoushanensis TaxID=1569283 RepID=UPI00167BF24A
LNEGGAAIGGQLTASDSDAGAVLIWSGSAAGAYGSFTMNADGSWSYALGASAEALKAGQVVTESFMATVTDEQGATATETVIVTITGANDGPVVTSATADARGALNEGGAAIGGQLTASDNDAGAVLTWSGSAAGAYGSFTMNADGSWSYALGAAAEALKAGQVVTESFTATVTDDQGATATEVVKITVTGTNDGPVALNVSTQTDQDNSVSGTLTATDIDNGATLVFALGADGPDHGSVLIQSDGNWTYTPDAGFAGLDRFDYTVTDDFGAAVTRTVTVAVNSAPYSNAGQQIVTLNILPEPGGLPAGSIFANASDVNATAVNLVVTLDRSGSVGQTQWTAMINAVADALETLADRFDGALTDVDVQIITYASSARVEGTFDLSDPGLIQMVRAMPYSGGQTNWTAALELTEDFFDAQPVGEKNFLYFITDGSPSSNTWQAVLDRLTDEATKGYSVDIEAFGVGSNVNYNTLALFDDTPTLLQGAEDLTDAFSQTPLFSAELVDLSVTLIADGVDQGQIADETAAGLVLSGFNATLSLADIDGLVTLLGEENRFSVTGGFDLDGDPTTVELTLFDSEVLGKAATAQDITGNDGSDLLFGSDEADSLSGGAGNDVMLGYGGDDTFVTGAGADTVLGGAGDDLIVVDSFDGLTGGRQETLDGGDGRDVLRIDLGGDLTADYMSLVDLSGIEALDMANGQANTVELTIADLLGMSGDQDDALAGLLGEDIGQSLTIYGDASDSVTLVGEAGGQFQATGAQVVDAGGAVLDIYQYTQGSDVLHTLAVDADVAVSMQPAA